MKHHLTSIAFVAVIVVVSAWLASNAGNSNKQEASVRSTHTVVGGDRSVQGSDSIDSVASLTVGLEQRLEQQPDDGKGWLLLAKSYHHLGRLDDARDAYRKADALGSADARVAAQLFGLTADTQ